MIKIRVNGREMEVEERLNLSELLKDLGISPKGIAVEINREIIPKSQYGSTFIKEGDRIEVVEMVGGG